MAFLAPTMLLGLLAATIPVALHFFYRSRYRKVPWAAMAFLLTSIEQTSRRLRFQEWLLLLLRVAVLVLLALALARPSTHRSTGAAGGDAVDAVLILDTSLSMGARDGTAPIDDPGSDPYLAGLRQFKNDDGTVTRLARAKAAALAVIAGLPANSTVQVIASADRAQLLGPEVPSHLDQAQRLVEEVRPTHLGTDFLPGIREAAAALRRGSSPNKELYLMSDMQRWAWEKQAAALKDELQEIAVGATVYLVRCGSQPPENVSVVGITPLSGLFAREPADFAVLVRNSGKEVVRHVSVALELDGSTRMGRLKPQKELSPEEKARRDVKALGPLGPGETQKVLLTLPLDQPGRRLVTAAIEPDDLEADNRFDLVIQVRDRVGILVVDGSPNEREPRKAASFYLRNALQPLPTEVVAAGKATPRLLLNKDVCVIVNVALEPGKQRRAENPPAEFVRALAGFVREGHNLMIVAGDRVDPETYNRLLYDQARLLPMRISGIVGRPEDEPRRPDRQSAATPPFQSFRQNEGYASLDNVEVRRALTLQGAKAGEAVDPLDEVAVLLRYTDGREAVVSKKRPGEGEVLLLTTSANDDDWDQRWTDWYVSPSFVPLALLSLNHLLGSQPPLYNRVAGEPLRWYPPRNAAARSYELVHPDGTRARLGYPTSVQGRAVLMVDPTHRAGVYQVEPVNGKTDEAMAAFAVVPDLRDSEDLDGVPKTQLDEQLGIPFIYLTAGAEGDLFAGAERLNREWTSWLLAVLLVLTLGETLLAWLCGRAW